MKKRFSRLAHTHTHTAIIDCDKFIVGIYKFKKIVREHILDNFRNVDACLIYIFSFLYIHYTHIKLYHIFLITALHAQVVA